MSRSTAACAREGFSAPEIYALDLAAGVILLEDFGSEPIADATAPSTLSATALAAAALAKLHGSGSFPDVLPVDDGETYRIPAYDLDALSIEVELLLDWYAPHRARAQLSSGAKATFVSLWRKILTEGLTAEVDLDPARLSFAEPDLAAGARRRRKGRHGRFPGLRARPSRL